MKRSLSFSRGRARWCLGRLKIMAPLGTSTESPKKWQKSTAETPTAMLPSSDAVASLLRTHQSFESWQSKNNWNSFWHSFLDILDFATLLLPASMLCEPIVCQDAYDTSVDPEDRSSKLSNGNVKANELLCGTRASLDDMIMAHLIALVKIATAEKREVLGPLIVSAPSPLLVHENLESEFFIAAKSMYQALGWSFPQHIGRILDSRETWQSLSWQPTWDFGSLVSDFSTGANLETIRNGSYWALQKRRIPLPHKSVKWFEPTMLSLCTDGKMLCRSSVWQGPKEFKRNGCFWEDIDCTHKSVSAGFIFD